VGPSLSLVRVMALVGGLGVVAAFFMPWVGSQGLLLSGQFLHNFLGGASGAELRRFLPNSSPSEIQLLRLLVDLFPACGALAAASVLIGGLSSTARGVLNAVWVVSGVIPLAAWVVGVGRLPPGSSFEVGLWLIALGSLAVLVGAGLELWGTQRARRRLGLSMPTSAHGSDAESVADW
jgi:hypothetical protein